MRRFLATTALVALTFPVPGRATVPGTIIVPVWHEGKLFNTIESMFDGQDPAKCNLHQNHHTHLALPGEGFDLSGWCDALTFRQKTFPVPNEVEGGTVIGATLEITLAFVSGDEPPTDQLPRDYRSESDTEVTVTEGTTTIGSSLDPAGGNVPFVSPHRLKLTVQTGHSYTITVDPYLGPHNEWRIDADFVLTTV